jgi:hypothetical protein
MQEDSRGFEIICTVGLLVYLKRFALAEWYNRDGLFPPFFCVVNADDFDFHFFPIYYRQHLECEAYK